VLQLCAVSIDNADAVRLNAELQQEYRIRYGGEDTTPIDPTQFDAPHGRFVVGYVDGAAVGCGGWRARDGGEDPELRPGDAEIKRMYVALAHRGRGYARAILAELEQTAAAAGRLRAVLESGTHQPESVTLYRSSGYEPIPAFGQYRDSPNSLFFGKPLTVPTGHPTGRPTGATRIGGRSSTTTER
jgi:GNAT superfamily N-acetyltransferase